MLGTTATRREERADDGDAREHLREVLLVGMPGRIPGTKPPCWRSISLLVRLEGDVDVEEGEATIKTKSEKI